MSDYQQMPIKSVPLYKRLAKRFRIWIGTPAGPIYFFSFLCYILGTLRLIVWLTTDADAAYREGIPYYFIMGIAFSIIAESVAKINKKIDRVQRIQTYVQDNTPPKGTTRITTFSSERKIPKQSSGPSDISNDNGDDDTPQGSN